MNGKVRKLLKIVLWTVGVIILIPIVLIATLPLWLGPIARPGVNATAPKFTKTPFDVGHLYLNPYTGRLEIGDFVMGNPAGYREPTMIAISNLVFDIDMGTLGDKYVHVEDIVVDGLYVAVVKGGENNVDNILQLQYNLAGGKEKYEAGQELSKAKQEGERQAAKAKAEAAAAKERAKLEAMTPERRRAYEEERELLAEAAANGSKKFVIDHVLIRNIKLKYSFLTIPIPVTVELRDLGKQSEGVTMSEFFGEIWKSILKSAAAASDGAAVLGGLLGDGAGKAKEALGNRAGKALSIIQGFLK